MRSALGLRILVSAVSAKVGGSACYIQNLVRSRALKESPHQFIFFVTPRLANSLEKPSANTRIVVIEAGLGSPWKRFFWDQMILRRIVKMQRADILVTVSDFGMFFPPCREILMTGNSLYCSPLYSEQILPRKSWGFRFEFILRRFLVFLSVRSSRVIVVTPSQSMLALINQLTPNLLGKSIVNYLGVPLEYFSSPQLPDYWEGHQDGDRHFQILHVSLYGDYKNLTVLLKAVRSLGERGVHEFLLVTTADPWQFPDAEVVTRDEDQILATDPLISPFIKFTGGMPYEDIPTLYAQSDLFVFPSLAESFGYPLVEAMASGLPIIASDIPTCREICGEAAIYFSPLDHKDLADKIILLKSDSDLRRKLTQSGTKRVEERFDWKDHVKRLLEHIEQVAVTSDC
jgi:glycosyltransferase involved in cell wall biosynthesis